MIHIAEPRICQSSGPLNGACHDGTCGCTPGWSGATCETVTYFVKPSGDDAQDGLAWETAFATVSRALGAAADDPRIATADIELWIAQGTYTPHLAIDPRSSTFQLVAGAHLYGGFLGTELSRDQRSTDPATTILSGEIGAAGAADNVHHVVTGTNGARLDGFTVTGGNSDGNGDNDPPGISYRGGGLLNVDAAPHIENVVFRDNQAGSGGAVYNDNSDATFVEVSFVDNTATEAGGAMANDSANPTLSHATFQNNLSLGDGGAMVNLSDSKPKLTDGRFADNEAQNGGAIACAGSANPTMTRLTFENNEAQRSGGAIVLSESASLHVVDTLFLSNAAIGSGGPGQGGAIANLSSTPLKIVGSTFKGNTAASTGAALAEIGGAEDTWVVNSIFDSNVCNTTGAVSVANSGEVGFANVVFVDNQGGSSAVWAQNGAQIVLKGVTFPKPLVNSADRLHPDLTSVIAVYNSVVAGPISEFTSANSGAIYVYTTLFDGGCKNLGTVLCSDGAHSGIPVFADVAAGDFRLVRPSPGIDQGNNTNRPADIADLDDDADTGEPIPFDLGGGPRVVGDAIDLGAYETPADDTM